MGEYCVFPYKKVCIWKNGVCRLVSGVGDANLRGVIYSKYNNSFTKQNIIGRYF